MQSSVPSFRFSRRGSRIRPCFVMLLPLLSVSAFLISCGGTRVLVSPSGAVVRAGADVKGHVYHWDGSGWVLSRNRVHIPEGWYIAPLEIENQ